MRVLAADTTGVRASVALVDDGELVGVVGFSTGRPHHAENLLPTIDLVLDRLSLRLADLDGLAIAAGPGSFTGIRIGIAALEGLAYATGKPVVGVSTLEATAFRHRHARGLIVSIVEAYRGEIYGASFRSDGRRLTPAGEPVCRAPEPFLRALPETPSLLVGTGTLAHRDTIEAVLGPAPPLADASFFLAEEVARLGETRLGRGEAAPLGGVEPIYLRRPEAERERAKREREEAVDA